MKQLQILLLLFCFVLLLGIGQGFAVTKNEKTTGVTFLESSLSDALTTADKPIMIDFWSDG